MAFPEHAYDLTLQPHRARRIAADGDHGWVYGLPRGISTDQWPLDPNFGTPLQHGFTLLLPPDYRCHGPDIVGFAFFGPTMESLADPWEAWPDLRDAILSKTTTGAYARYGAHAQNAHPRMHYMTDILDAYYAVILLTEAEITGPQTQPPDFAMPDGYKGRWQDQGVAYIFHIDTGWFDLTGGPPTPTLAENRAIKWTPRANDPNVGKKPREDWGEVRLDFWNSYTGPYDPDNGFELHDWAKDHSRDHIGGTMYPIQGVPDVSLYYIGFGEHFGGFNFGTGAAQLDFKFMRFDWAQ